MGKKPPHLSRAYRKFERVIERSLNLLSLQEKLDESLAQMPKRLDLSDLSRSAIVLAVAAMDGYFTDFFTENLVKYLKRKGTNGCLITMLAKAGLDTKTALELLAMKRPYRGLRTLVETSLERKVTQKFDVVDELFLAYRIKNFCKSAEGLANRKTLLSSIRELVERRHCIVHDGDTNSHGRLKGISLPQVRRRVQHVVKFVSASEQLLRRVLP